jgi:hypothetical protein
VSSRRLRFAPIHTVHTRLSLSQRLSILNI